MANNLLSELNMPSCPNAGYGRTVSTWIASHSAVYGANTSQSALANPSPLSKAPSQLWTREHQNRILEQWRVTWPDYIMWTRLYIQSLQYFAILSGMVTFFFLNNHVFCSVSFKKKSTGLFMIMIISNNL